MNVFDEYSSRESKTVRLEAYPKRTKMQMENQTALPYMFCFFAIKIYSILHALLVPYVWDNYICMLSLPILSCKKGHLII